MGTPDLARLALRLGGRETGRHHESRRSEGDLLMTVTRTATVLRLGVLALTVLAIGCSQDPEKLKRKYMASGDAYMAQHKYSEAIIEYRNATQQDDHFGEARYKLAGAYVRAGNGSRALAEAVRAA